jgi:hypothetical protein
MQGVTYFGHAMDLEHIPLLPRRPAYDVGAICKSFPRYEEIRTLPLDTYEQVCAYEPLFREYQTFVRGKLPFMSPEHQTFGCGDVAHIRALKQTLISVKDVRARRYYETPLSFLEEDMANGYRLLDLDLNKQIEFETFLFIHEQWDDDDDMDDVKFVRWLEENCCTDWNKQDRHGNPFGGFWKYDEGTYEYEHAYELSREDNFKGLCELPFPRWIIMKTVDWGCKTREESVRFSNFCCVWLERKREQMFPSLQSLAKRVIEANKLSFF